MTPTARARGPIEFREPIAARPHISHVIFDFDGTLSWLRHGWPGIMVQLFREYWPADPLESEEAIQALLMDDVLSLNGKATIFQMQRCVERVAERGGQAPTAEALQAEYGRRLESAIQERTQQIRRAEVAPDDFVVCGARPLLELLAAQDLRLIILSGTVEPRVREEAALLNLAKYFGDHIYGATSDLTRSSKRAVIERILREEKVPGANLLSFGDGPVEMQLTREVGGLAVGVASDEEVNGSGCMDRFKRAQLVGAGAQLLVPDYSRATEWIDSLLGK